MRGQVAFGANKSVFPSRDDQFWGVTPLTDAFMMEIEPSQNCAANTAIYDFTIVSD